MKFGVAAYAIVRDTETEAKRELERITNVKQFAAGYENYQQWLAGTKLEQQVSLEDYSVSNRGLRSGLVGTPDQVAERVAEFEDAGVDLLLLQCSPQLEEMERFAETVIRPKETFITRSVDTAKSGQRTVIASPMLSLDQCELSSSRRRQILRASFHRAFAIPSQALLCAPASPADS